VVVVLNIDAQDESAGIIFTGLLPRERSPVGKMFDEAVEVDGRRTHSCVGRTRQIGAELLQWTDAVQISFVLHPQSAWNHGRFRREVDVEQVLGLDEIERRQSGRTGGTGRGIS